MIDIREVRQEDVPDVLVLVAEVLSEHGLEFGKGSPTDEQLRQLPASYDGGAFWVAHHDATLIGTCGVFPVEPGTFELRKMYLRPSVRGLGAGKQLLDVAVTWTRSHGGIRLVLDTVESMSRAIAFYEANGFTRDDTQIRGSRCTRGYTLTLR